MVAQATRSNCNVICGSFLLCGLTLLTAAVPPLFAQQRVKVFIAVDMEGVTGVVGPEQLGPTGFEYQRFREFMTAEALAAIEGAREAGATEILVADSHGNGQNLLIERFSPDVRIVRSWPRPLGMMQGIDSSFAAAVFIGFHSGTANPAGVRAHTFSSANLAGLTVNGQELSESGFGAAVAGHFGVPVVFISGDDVATAELRALVPDVETVVVKQALGFHSAVTATPAAAQARIRERVRAAVIRRSAIAPFRVAGPVAVEITFKNYRPAEMLSYLSLFTRTASHRVRYAARDMVEATRILQFVEEYEFGLAP
jgi:D-amino peptidase